MESQISIRITLLLLAAAFLASTSTMMCVSARYLPTRSQEDRLERLRELLKDLFNSDNDQNRSYPSQSEIQVIPDRAAIFKRSSGQQTVSDRESAIKAMATRTGIPSAVLSNIGDTGFLQIPVLDNSFMDPDRKGMK